VDGIPVENILIRGTYGTGGGRLLLKTVHFWTKALRKLLSSASDFDVIHCQDLNTLIPGFVAAKMLRKPLVYDAHDPYPEMLELTQPKMIVNWARFIEKFLCQRVDCVVTVNQLMRKRFEKITKKPIHVVYNYPELEHFTPKTSSAQSHSEAIVIGRIGTVQPQVGIEETIEAFKHVLHHQGLRLLFVGRLSESMKTRFESLIDSIRDRVRIVEDVPYFEVPRYYEKMDISMVLYPSKGIAPYISPVKLFESMAMGVPVVACDVGEIREVVESSKCGFVVKQEDVSSIARSLSKLFFSASLRQEMGRNGLMAARTKYNWERERNKLIHVYESVSSRRRRDLSVFTTRKEDHIG